MAWISSFSYYFSLLLKHFLTFTLIFWRKNILEGKSPHCHGTIQMQLLIFRSSHQRCSIWKSVLRNFTNFTGKHLCQSLFSDKVCRAQETLAQVLSYEICDISKSTFFTEHLWTTASISCLFIAFHNYFKPLLRVYYFSNMIFRTIIRLLNFA